MTNKKMRSIDQPPVSSSKRYLATSASIVTIIAGLALASCGHVGDAPQRTVDMASGQSGYVIENNGK